MVDQVLYSHQRDTWRTPHYLFQELNKKHNFQLDPCANENNSLGTPFYFTKQDDGLSQEWYYRSVFINPPFSDVAKWVKKASEQAKKYPFITIVMLIAARTDTRWFHDYIYKKNGVTVEFMRGRIKFDETKVSAPFPSMIVTFNDNISYQNIKYYSLD